MKRRLIKLGLLILAGAIVNVAVAWGCGAWVDVERASTQAGGVGFDDVKRDGDSGWYVEIKTMPAAVRIYRFWHVLAKRTWSSNYTVKQRDQRIAHDMSNQVPWWSQARHSGAAPAAKRPHYWCEDARGWPLVCLKCQIDISSLTLKRLPRAQGESLEGDRLVHRDASGKLMAFTELARAIASRMACSLNGKARGFDRCRSRLCGCLSSPIPLSTRSAYGCWLRCQLFCGAGCASSEGCARRVAIRLARRQFAPSAASRFRVSALHQHEAPPAQARLADSRHFRGRDHQRRRRVGIRVRISRRHLWQSSAGARLVSI